MRIFTTLLFSLLTICSCSNINEYGTIDDAEYLFNQKEYNNSQRLCDYIIENNDITNIPHSVLCRLSVIYLKLAEQTKESEDKNTAIATRCYRTAFNLDKDSSNIYFSEIPTEDIKYAILLNSLSNAIDSPCEIHDFEFTDSCNFNHN